MPNKFVQKRIWGLIALGLSGLVVLFIVSCQLSPLYTGPIIKRQRLFLKQNARIAIFSVLVREVAVSNSQGHDWTAWHYDQDYNRLYQAVSDILQENWQARIVPVEQIHELALYKDGYFPLKERFYLNTKNMPIITNSQIEEFMLRTKNRLENDYFVTMILEHSMSKTMFRPATTSSQLDFNLYDANAGMIYQCQVQDEQTALPYHREWSMAKLKKEYDPIVNQALKRSLEVMLQKLASQLKQDLAGLEINIQHAQDK